MYFQYNNKINNFHYDIYFYKSIIIRNNSNKITFRNYYLHFFFIMRNLLFNDMIK